MRSEWSQYFTCAAHTARQRRDGRRRCDCRTQRCAGVHKELIASDNRLADESVLSLIEECSNCFSASLLDAINNPASTLPDWQALLTRIDEQQAQYLTAAAEMPAAARRCDKTSWIQKRSPALPRQPEWDGEGGCPNCRYPAGS